VTRHTLLDWVFSRWAFGVVCCALAAITAGAESQKTAIKATAEGAQAAATPAHERRVAPELADFTRRVERFSALRHTLKATLPALSNEATPEQIDRNQRALATLVSASRSRARSGNMFTPMAQVYIRAMLKELFTNANKKQLRQSIQDENPGPVRLVINGRYPERVPLSTMPPEVLEALPPLPEDLEYRFVGDTLILLDSHAHIVIDQVPNALPR